MIRLPEFNEQSMYDAETHFHLMMREDRLAKFLVHWEAFKLITNIPGYIIECGVFKGTSFVRFALIRQLLGGSESARLVGFDVFSNHFPSTSYSEDLAQRDHWIETAGGSSIGKEQLESILVAKGISNFELVKGDALITIPNWVNNNPGARISLLNIDIDFYEPTKLILETFYSKMSRGGVILLDNYSGQGSSGHSYHGDTAPVDEFVKDMNIKLFRFPFASRPAYIIKD